MVTGRPAVAAQATTRLTGAATAVVRSAETRIRSPSVPGSREACQKISPAAATAADPVATAAATARASVTSVFRSMRRSRLLTAMAIDGKTRAWRPSGAVVIES